MLWPRNRHKSQYISSQGPVWKLANKFSSILLEHTQEKKSLKALSIGMFMSRKKFSARIFRENRKSCFSAGSGFFTYRPKFSALLNLRPNQIGSAKYQATPLPPNTKSYSYSIPHLSRSLHDFIGSHGDSGGHIKQTVCCGKKVIFICIVVSCLYY